MFLKIGKGYSELCINCYKTHAPKDKNTNTLNALLVLEGKCKCGICKQIKPMIVFVKSNHTISGYKSICKKCFNIVHKRNRIKKSYGITIENLDYLLRKQNSLCKICNNEITFIKEKNKRRGCIDHNHKNKKVRGLLCDHCNRAIGLLGDDTNILYAAIRYLKSDHVKLGELLENPEVDNQQPNLGSE